MGGLLIVTAGAACLYALWVSGTDAEPEITWLIPAMIAVGLFVIAIIVGATQ